MVQNNIPESDKSVPLKHYPQLCALLTTKNSEIERLERWQGELIQDKNSLLDQTAEAVALLNGCRDILLLNTLLDKSGQTQAVLDKVENFLKRKRVALKKPNRITNR